MKRRIANLSQTSNFGYGRTFYPDDPEDLSYLKGLAKDILGSEDKWPRLGLRIAGVDRNLIMTSRNNNGEKGMAQGKQEQNTTYVESSTGSVIWFSNQKGFGFISPDGGGEDLFCHFSCIRMNGYKALKEGQRVSYRIEPGPTGRPQAADIIVLDEGE